MTEARCERSDLPVPMCAHCRGHQDPLGRLGEDDVGPLFTASYRSRCDRCDGDIHPGDTIAAFIDEAGYACEECLP